MPKLLLINGPPKSGKDTVVRELIPYIKFRHMKFAMPIKRAVAALLDMRESDLENYKDVQSNVLQHKDRITKEYRDTPRDLIIHISNMLKDKYGEDFLGRIFWQHAKTSAEQLIIGDCGDGPEAERVISNAGRKNCVLVRVHRDGCNFDGDSRLFLRDGLCDTWDVDNNGEIHLFTMKILRLITREMGLVLQKEPDWTKSI